MRGGAGALSGSGPVIFCVDEDGGWNIGKMLSSTLSDGGLWKDHRPPVRRLMEGRAPAVPEMSWRPLTGSYPMEDDLKDRSIFIFSFVSHVSDFS